MANILFQVKSCELSQEYTFDHVLIEPPVSALSKMVIGLKTDVVASVI